MAFSRPLRIFNHTKSDSVTHSLAVNLLQKSENMFVVAQGAQISNEIKTSLKNLMRNFGGDERED